MDAGVVVFDNLDRSHRTFGVAITAPAAGSFAYDVYDMAVNSILKGPIGFVAGLAAVCFGAALAIQQKIGGAIPALLGGAVLLKADTIVSSMGLLY